MAKIRNVSGEDLIVPWLGGRTVVVDEVVDVPDADVDSYICQESNWEPVAMSQKAPSTKAVQS